MEGEEEGGREREGGREGGRARAQRSHHRKPHLNFAGGMIHDCSLGHAEVEAQQGGEGLPPQALPWHDEHVTLLSCALPPSHPLPLPPSPSTNPGEGGRVGTVAVDERARVDVEDCWQFDVSVCVRVCVFLCVCVCVCVYVCVCVCV